MVIKEINTELNNLIQRNKNVEIRCTQHVSETTMITHGQGQGQKTGMPKRLDSIRRPFLKVVFTDVIISNHGPI
jgi:hypothetical protein